jgi:pantoate--beta-alanine ligase
MRTIRSVERMSAWSRSLHREGVRIGLVPTMGALHDGHRALIRAARLSCDAVVVSVFVNPLQFGPREDFMRYPRQLRGDAALCRAEGADVLFAPAIQTMYPSDFQTRIVVEHLSKRWEGEARPGHFDGVATVVTKLLNIVQPDLAFFGQKDFQQAVLVRKLVEDLHLPVRIVVHPTVREPDGLALSSRNRYLTAPQRRAATVLHRALRVGEEMIDHGVRTAEEIRRAMLRSISTEPAVEVNYVAVCDPRTLEPLHRIETYAVLLGAITIGRTRLLDNVLVRARSRSRTRRSGES